MGRRCTIIGGIKLWLPLPYRFDSTYAKFILCPINYAMLLTISPNEKTDIGTIAAQKHLSPTKQQQLPITAAIACCVYVKGALLSTATTTTLQSHSEKNWQETVTWIIFIIVFGYQIKADTTKNIIRSPFLGHRGGPRKIRGCSKCSCALLAKLGLGTRKSAKAVSEN